MVVAKTRRQGSYPVNCMYLPALLSRHVALKLQESRAISMSTVLGGCCNKNQVFVSRKAGTWKAPNIGLYSNWRLLGLQTSATLRGLVAYDVGILGFPGGGMSSDTRVLDHLNLSV